MRDPSPSADYNAASLLARSAREWPLFLRWRLEDRRCATTERSRSGRRSSPARSHRLGLQRGDRVALVSRNVPEYVEAMFACWWAGAVAVPVNAKLHPRELAFVLADSGARGAFVDGDWESAIAAAGEGHGDLEHVMLLGGAAYERLVADPRRRRSRRARATIRRGSSTRAARPDDPRAWRSRTGISMR